MLFVDASAEAMSHDACHSDVNALSGDSAKGGGDGFIPDIAYPVRYLNREIAERELGVQMGEALSESRPISIDAFWEQLKASQKRCNERVRSEMKRIQTKHLEAASLLRKVSPDYVERGRAN